MRNDTSSPDNRDTDRRDEPPWLLVTRREVVSRITDKSFLLGTAFMVVLIAGFIGFNAWQEERTDTVTLAATPDAAAMATAVADATQALIQWAVDHCPVLDTVRRAIPIELVAG